MRESIRANLVATLPALLVDELLDAYEASRKNFFLGGLRLSGVEGGRFAEACFRILEFKTTGAHTPLDRQLRTDRLIANLAQAPAAEHSASTRIHIPRTLRVVYDIRNRRDIAHLGDDIDPNVQDATLVMASLNWILAELVREHHKVTPQDASDLVDRIVARRAPVVQDFGGRLKVLNPKLSASDHVLILLYDVGKAGASFDQIHEWVRPSMRKNLRRTLERLVDVIDLVHFDGLAYVITRLGEQHVESSQLFDR